MGGFIPTEGKWWHALKFVQHFRLQAPDSSVNRSSRLCKIRSQWKKFGFSNASARHQHLPGQIFWTKPAGSFILFRHAFRFYYPSRCHTLHNGKARRWWGISTDGQRFDMMRLRRRGKRRKPVSNACVSVIACFKYRSREKGFCSSIYTGLINWFVQHWKYWNGCTFQTVMEIVIRHFGETDFVEKIMRAVLLPDQQVRSTWIEWPEYMYFATGLHSCNVDEINF